MVLKVEVFRLARRHVRLRVMTEDRTKEQTGRTEGIRYHLVCPLREWTEREAKVHISHRHARKHLKVRLTQLK